MEETTVEIIMDPMLIAAMGAALCVAGLGAAWIISHAFGSFLDLFR